MIKDSEILEIGRVLKPHGVCGEMVVVLDCLPLSDIAPDDLLSELRCLIFDVDGIKVPFFISEVRPRGTESVLITLEDVNSDLDAAFFKGKELYALRTDLNKHGVETDEDGNFADSFIGFTLVDADNGKTIGNISDIDCSTENYLFIVSTDDREIMVPVADELVTGYDMEKRNISMHLPEGLTELN
ncbi:MAG: ribosome maturation factor RimM [Muribaculaceae bacterium]|nr:ribosome maturation factor RimM [Muribaculaceae bacterium]